MSLFFSSKHTRGMVPSDMSDSQAGQVTLKKLTKRRSIVESGPFDGSGSPAFSQASPVPVAIHDLSSTIQRTYATSSNNTYSSLTSSSSSFDRSKIQQVVLTSIHSTSDDKSSYAEESPSTKPLLNHQSLSSASSSSSGASSSTSSTLLFTDEVPEEGTLEEILRAMPHRNIVAPILLYTYRTFATIDDIITTMDKIMVETICSPEYEASTRDKFICAFKSFLIEWLSVPYVEDFNQPPKFSSLYRVSQCVRGWHSLLSQKPQFQPSRRAIPQMNGMQTSDSVRSQQMRLNLNPVLMPAEDVWDEVFRRLEAAFNSYLTENQNYVEKCVDVGTEDAAQVVESGDDVDEGGFDIYSGSRDRRCTTLVPPLVSDPTHLDRFNAKLIAAQLTIIDKEIFSTLVPHHCLFRVRYHRWPSSPNLHDAHNRLSKVVEFTLRLGYARAISAAETILYKWVLVAKELRALKNYNSLTSIAQTLRKLQDEFPLLFKRVEKLYSKAALVLQEVEKLSEPSGNYEYVRYLQREEASGKVGQHSESSYTGNPGGRKALTAFGRMALDFVVGRDTPPEGSGNASYQHQNETPSSRMYGAVPFLAPYLYDLTLALHARPDFTKDGRINFRKKLQEFHILVTIYCLQSSTKYYEDLRRDEAFLEWYNNLHLEQLDDDDATMKVHREPDCTSHESVASSAQSLALSSEDKRSVADGQSSDADPEPLLMRVQLVESGFPAGRECDAALCYKGVVVTPNDMMPTVIRRCLEKFGRDPRDHHLYILVQRLPNRREIMLPETQNAYYALAKDSPTAILCELRAKPLEKKSARSVKSSLPKSKSSFVEQNASHPLQPPPSPAHQQRQPNQSSFIRKHLRNLSSVSLQ